MLKQRSSVIHFFLDNFFTGTFLKFSFTCFCYYVCWMSILVFLAGFWNISQIACFWNTRTSFISGQGYSWWPSTWQGIDNDLFQKKIISVANAYFEPGQTSKMNLFAKIIKGWSLLTVFVENSVLNVWRAF